MADEWSTSNEWQITTISDNNNIASSEEKQQDWRQGRAVEGYCQLRKMSRFEPRCTCENSCHPPENKILSSVIHPHKNASWRSQLWARLYEKTPGPKPHGLGPSYLPYNRQEEVMQKKFNLESLLESDRVKILYANFAELRQDFEKLKLRIEAIDINGKLNCVTVVLLRCEMHRKIEETCFIHEQCMNMLKTTTTTTTLSTLDEFLRYISDVMKHVVTKALMRIDGIHMMLSNRKAK